MKVIRQATVAVLFLVFPMVARSSETPASPLASVLQHIAARAQQEADNDRAFDQLYGYSREKITEYRNGTGDLKKREVKTGVHQPDSTLQPQLAAAPTDSGSLKTETGVSDTHSNIRGQTFKKNDFLLNQDLINRFEFTLAGQELINGRTALMIDFVPASKNLPERNIKDRFINKAAGRIWVDAEDYALVKADLHLSRQVDVAFGLVGSVWKFNYGFERARTDDGFWFTRNVSWHLEGREVVVNRTVDYHETTTHLQKVATVASR